MKFLLVIESIEVSAGGPAKVAAAVAEGLSLRGHNVAIATINSTGQPIEINSKVDLIFLKQNIYNPLKWLFAAHELYSISRNYDIIVISGIWGILDGLIVMLSGIARKKCFIRPCGMLEPYILNRNKIKKKLAFNLYVKSNLLAATALLPNTSIEEANIRKIGINTPCIIIPNGANPPQGNDRLSKADSRIKLGINAKVGGRSIILFMARLHPKKGLDLLVDAFLSVPQLHTEWALLIAGASEDIEYVKKIKAKIPAHDGSAIAFVGEVAGESKRACFSVADVFALPSHSEGFPNSVIEAISWGLPSLITPGCNFPALSAAGAGIEVQPHVSEIASGLITICDQSFIDESKPKISLLAQKYTLNAVLDKYEMLSNCMSVKM